MKPEQQAQDVALDAALEAGWSLDTKDRNGTYWLSTVVECLRLLLVISERSLWVQDYQGRLRFPAHWNHSQFANPERWRNLLAWVATAKPGEEYLGVPEPVDQTAVDALVDLASWDPSKPVGGRR